MRRVLALFALFGAGCARVSSDDAESALDLALQGEYAAPGAPLAAQVIALGGGRLRAVLLGGGLPGAGWDGRGRVALEGLRSAGGGVAHFEGEPRAELRSGSMWLETREGERLALPRAARESPTLGAPPPPGAVVIFDGTGLDEVEGAIDAGGLLLPGARSRRSFGDFRLHLEFRTPFEPRARGQGRGNSGVYLQDRYEIQVLDSFGLEASDDGCGALYRQRAPDLNMALPPLAWQTYDVEFRAARFADAERIAPARVSVVHNGVPIHRDVALAGPTAGGRAEGPEPGPLHLQDHGNAVRYRNVWIEPIH